MPYQMMALRLLKFLVDNAEMVLEGLSVGEMR
jgi:hypothetical protein